LAKRPPPPALSSAPLEPGLFLVATPIGNLRDITLRALDVLAGADLILAEDTRVAARLLSAYGVARKVERYDDHSGRRLRPRVLELLANEARVALISDAGTPLISDPGYRLVVEAVAAGVRVFPVPGASAVLAALAAAGLPTDRFLFAGFSPPKAGARRTFLKSLKDVRATLVLFEGVSRLAASLSDMADVLGPRPAAVARELTKFHETVRRGDLASLAADRALAAPKGEVVVVIGPPPDAPPADADIALRDALGRLPPTEAAREVARVSGLSRRALYQRALELKGR
jgi:16S rRNA (cytidine1402-2'-O)-methyltransferase